jgi:hypothetical protein
MSYNPARVSQTGGAARKNRSYNPHAGRKHSQIVSPSGPSSVRFADYNNRKDTPFGWSISIFKGKNFEVEYQFMCARNASGKLCHPTKDRCIRVLGGRLFVLIGEETVTVDTHQAFTVEAGVEYMLATSGTGDVELLICQGADYEQDLTHVTQPEAVNVMSSMAPVRPEGEAKPPREGSMAYQQAAQMAEQQAQKRAQRTPVKGKAPLPGQQVDGFNPRPVGAGGFSEE